MPAALDHANDIFNIIFAFYFLAEMAVKLAGLGLGNYMRNRMNIFDGRECSGSEGEAGPGRGCPG